MSAASDAAAVAAMLPIDHPLAQLARMSLDRAVREEFTMKIYAPDRAASRKTYLGAVEQQRGGAAVRVPIELDFRDGVAEVDRALLNDGALDYLRRAGYGIDAPAQPSSRQPAGMDHFRSTAKLRDAATDPAATGEIDTIVRDSADANPHGPGVHAVEVGSRDWGRLVDEQRAAAGPVTNVTPEPAVDQSTGEILTDLAGPAQVGEIPTPEPVVDHSLGEVHTAEGQEHADA